MPSMKATTMPTPPPFGVGVRCALRASGVSMMRTDIIAATTIAETNANPPQNAR